MTAPAWLSPVQNRWMHFLGIESPHSACRVKERGKERGQFESHKIGNREITSEERPPFKLSESNSLTVASYMCSLERFKNEIPLSTHAYGSGHNSYDFDAECS